MTPSEYAVNIRIIWLCNGLTIRNVEDRQAGRLFVVFNGQGSFSVDQVLFENAAEHPSLKTVDAQNLRYSG